MTNINEWFGIENMPKLVGSEKQVSWANTLREDFVRKAYGAMMSSQVRDNSELFEIFKGLTKQIVETETDAQFYINTRDYKSDSMIQMFKSKLNESETPAVEIKLADLQGTENQIAFAKKKRNELIINIKENIEKANNLRSRGSNNIADGIMAKVNRVLEVVATETSSKWWIETSRADVSYMVSNILK